MTSSTLKLLIVCSLIVCSLAIATLDDIDRSDIPQIIESRGFICESHYIVTSDGYILGNYRIVNPLASKHFKEPLKPVIIQSGFLGSATDFIINAPTGQINEQILANYTDLDSVDFESEGQNLGFILANLGYDVWLTNPRGNYYSTNHTTLDPKEDGKQFWSFSLDEMALIDLPAMIDYVLNNTGQSSLAYIGYSRGSAIMFALLSEKPEYSDKISPFIAMAPPVFLNNEKSYYRALASSKFILNFIRDHPGSCFGRAITDIAGICNNFLIKPLCHQLEMSLLSIDRETSNATRINIYLSHLPAGAPCWDLIYFSQRITQENFTHIDLGPDFNMKRYGSKTPPMYNLRNIVNQDIYILHSTGDKRASPVDVQKLVDELEVFPADRITIEDEKFSHLDFFLDKNVAQRVNKPIAKILDRYRST
ncbi:lipase member K [Tetranychus urticae]|uniref:Lipase n=1 Tax=Tetranychus urticae TaxID=32264 RepID=T1KVL1_TETUR|nr:lipase member K [Tetranychus urticae]